MATMMVTKKDVKCKMKSYLYRVMIAVSMLLNVVLGGAIGQTFSARHYGRKKRGQWNLVWAIDGVVGKDHCMCCWAYWRVRKW